MLRSIVMAIALLAGAQHALAQPTIASAEAEKTVGAGGEIYSTATIYESGGARLGETVSWGKGIFKTVYPAGTPLVSVATKVKFKGCKEWVGTTSLEPCFLDDDGDGKFDRMAASQSAKAFELDAPVAYERDGLKQVILYQGATSDSIRFSYREFSSDLARPAFTEDLVVPRAPFPQLVALKNIRIEVLAISGLGLKYRLASTPNSAAAP